MSQERSGIRWQIPVMINQLLTYGFDKARTLLRSWFLLQCKQILPWYWKMQNIRYSKEEAINFAFFFVFGYNSFSWHRNCQYALICIVPLMNPRAFGFELCYLTLYRVVLLYIIFLFQFISLCKLEKLKQSERRWERECCPTIKSQGPYGPHVSLTTISDVFQYRLLASSGNHSLSTLVLSAYLSLVYEHLETLRDVFASF